MMIDMTRLIELDPSELIGKTIKRVVNNLINVTYFEFTDKSHCVVIMHARTHLPTFWKDKEDVNKMNFKCKECGSDRLEEVMKDVIVSTEILSVGEGGDIEYGNADNDGGEVEHYQCLKCGDVLECEPFSDRLAEYLYEQHGPKNITIKINCENAAFKDTNAELPRILRRLAERIESGESPDRIMDVNGNCVGTFEEN